MDIRVFIGYDSKEVVAYHVLSQSILRHSKKPVSITPLCLDKLREIGLFNRENVGTTEFSLTRFLVPYLSGYEGVSIFMDCDMLVKCDLIEEIQKYVNFGDGKLVYCCQHYYTPKTTEKATGQQIAYPRKNWSSMMVFKNSHLKHLNPEYINSSSGQDLHRFAWVDDKQIGSLPLGFNWLVGEYPIENEAMVLHYTLGTPCFPEYKNCDHSEEWHKEYSILNTPVNF